MLPKKYLFLENPINVKGRICTIFSIKIRVSTYTEKGKSFCANFAFFAKKIFRQKFHTFSHIVRYAKFCEKVCKIRTKIFPFFRKVFVRWKPSRKCTKKQTVTWKIKYKSQDCYKKAKGPERLVVFIYKSK